jgi:hypothetical protein
MYSRFIVWQTDTRLDSQAEVQEVNTFCLTEQALDIRFRLKGYGFKKVGETNRVICHFGGYKCYYRKVGDTNWTLFTSIKSERAGDAEPKVYEDISVGTGIIEFGLYEIKIVASELVELSFWSGGIVEGISAGDQFYYNVSARQQLPNKVSAEERILVEENFIFGCDPIPLFANDPNPELFDGIQYADLCWMVLEHNIYGIWEEFIVEDVLHIEYHYFMDLFFEFIPVNERVFVVETPLHARGSNFGDSIAVQEFITLAFYPFYSLWYQNIEVKENISANIFGTINFTENITVQDVLVDLNVFGDRLVWSAISVVDYAQVFVDYAPQVFERVYVAENLAIYILYSTTVWNNVFVGEWVNLTADWKIDAGDYLPVVKEFVDVNIIRSRQVFNTVTVAEFIDVNVYGARQVWEDVTIEEDAMVQVQPNIIVSESIAVVDALDELFNTRFIPLCHEDISVIEFVSASSLFIFSVDGIIVTEVVYVLLPQIRVSDDIVVAEETVIDAPYYSIDVFTTVTIVEEWIWVTLDRLNLPLSIENIAVSEFFGTILGVDNIQITEYVEMVEDLGIFFIDYIVILEYINANIIAINVAQDITVTEFIKIECLSPSVWDVALVWAETVYLQFEFNWGLVSDSVAITDYATAYLVYLVNVYESITIEDSGIASAMSFAVYDNCWVQEIAIAELPYAIVEYDTIPVSESASLNVYGTCDVHDDISTEDSALVRISHIIFAIEDIIYITEYASVAGVFRFDVFNEISVTEFIYVQPPYLEKSTHEDITVTEVVTLRRSETVEVFNEVWVYDWVQMFLLRYDLWGVEELHVVEAVTVIISILNINQSQNIAISEFVNLARSVLYIDVQDTVTVTEQAVWTVFYRLEVFETISHTEQVFISLDRLNLPTRFEYITITEHFGFWFNVSENISITEFVTLGLTTTSIFALENINCVEYINIEIAPREAEVSDEASVNGALFDTVYVAEYALLSTATNSRLISDAYDESFVNGALYDSIAVSEFIQLVRV